MNSLSTRLACYSATQGHQLDSMIVWAGVRGVRQGCPLASFVFLIVGEALNCIFIKTMGEGGILRVRLAGGKQQCILEYVEDSSLFFKGEKFSIDELVRLLKAFCRASSMEINWRKSCAYWINEKIPKPSWIISYNWTWAEENDLSKLL